MKRGENMMGRAKKRSLRRLDLRVRMILSTVVVACFFLLVGGVYVDLFANMAERQVDELSGLLASEVDSQMRRTADIRGAPPYRLAIPATCRARCTPLRP